jgi:hypothetical protein
VSEGNRQLRDIAVVLALVASPLLAVAARHFFPCLLHGGMSASLFGYGICADGTTVRLP